MEKKPSAKQQCLSRRLTPKKSFGQNFMMDQQVNAIFASSVASFGRQLCVVEIGAGTGSLTHHLLSVASLVHAIERDRDLLPIIFDHFIDESKTGRLIVHEANATKFDISLVLGVKNKGVLAGNLPYHLTSSIILLAIKNRAFLYGAVFLVQKEVATRLLSGANSKNYGFLTIILSLGFSLEKILDVDRGAFWPTPKVDATIIKMTTIDNGLGQVNDLDKFIFFVREIFQQRRKKLSTILGKKMSPQDFLLCAIDPNMRPENLEPKQFLAMFLTYTKPIANN